MAVVADELLLNVKANVTQAMAGLQAVDTKASGMGGAFKKGAKIAGKAVAGVGIAAVGVGIASGKMALDFEENMASIEALVGVPKDEMKILEEAALRMGSEFGVGATEAAEGLFFLKSAGLETSEAIEGLEDAAKANAIGLGTMEDLANTATTMMTNFGVEGADAYDGIATAAKLAKADPSELGDIMNRNAATANLAGVSFDELGGVSALMTRKLGDASAAGTAIQGVMNKIVKPSQQAEEMLGKVGMTSADLKEAVSKKGLMGALKDLNGAFEDQGIATDEWAGRVFEDANAMKGAAAIIGTSGDELNEIMGGMEEKAGALDEGWGVMAETGNVKLKKAFEGIKSALIPFGQTLQTLVVPMLETLAGWLEKGGQWLSTLQGSADGFSFDALIGQFKPLKKTIESMVKWWSDNWDSIEEVLLAFKDYFMTIFNDVKAWAVPFIEDFIAFVQDVFGDWIQWFQDNWPQIKETVMIVLDKIQKVWNAVWPVIQQVLETTWGVIKAVVSGVMKAIRGIIEVVMGLIRGDWDQVWGGIKKIVSGVWDAIFGAIKTILGDIWKHLKNVLGAIKDWWDEKWGQFKDVFRGMLSGVANGLRGPFNTIIGFIERGINSVINLINSAIDKVNSLPGLSFSKIGKVSIPRLAGGGVITRGGMALINDGTSPEQVGMARGALVRPTSPGDTSGGGGPLVHIEHMHGQDPHKVAADIGWELHKRGAA